MSAVVAPGPRARAGNALVLAGLAVIAGLLAAWHGGTWWTAMPSTGRWLASTVLLLAFSALCAWQWRAARRDRSAADRAVVGDAVLIAWASQTGFAQQLALHSADVLRSAGLGADVRALEAVDAVVLARVERALLVVSTTGEGDAPDHALRVLPTLLAGHVRFDRLRYAVLALGDRRYARFCAFGRELDHALQQAGAQPLFDRVEVDGGDAGALRHWQHHLVQLTGRTDLPDWAAPEYARWKLVEREWLNPGSPGGPAYRIALVPEDASKLQWEAGDIAEIGPRHPHEVVRAWLDATGLDGNAAVERDGEPTTLAELASRCALPPAPETAGTSPRSIAATLHPLPHREYSIASLPSDGRLELVVRRMQHADGRPGLGSGWLTLHAAEESTVDLRIRANAGFRAPSDDRPAVLIGNGTGIAGLRAVLKARIARGHVRNWLLFGERTRAHDALFDQELEHWQRTGMLVRCDRAYSREGSGPRYVQDALRAELADLRDWLDAGAAVYVCGGLAGMAPAVDAVLREAIGDDALEEIAAAGRYRRDVY